MNIAIAEDEATAPNIGVGRYDDTEQVQLWRQVLPSILAWDWRLRNIPVGNDVHLETLREFSQRILRFPEPRAASNPLVELVAESTTDEVQL